MINADAISGLAGATVEKYRLLKLTGERTYKHCQPGDLPYGTNEADAAVDEDITIHLLSRLGSLELEIDGAITYGARVYPGVDGKGTAMPVGRPVGVAQGTLSDGGVIDVLPMLGLEEAGWADMFEVRDDFMNFDATEGPFIVTADAGSTGGQDVTDAVGGVMAVYTDGDDNDEAYLHTVTEDFKFAAGKPILFEARVAPTDSATNVGAFILGLLSAAGADALVDTEGGPKANYSGVTFYKVAGSLVWSAEVSIGATQTPIVLAGAGVTYVPGTFYKFGILVVPTSSTLMNVYLFIDGVQVGSATGVTYTGATEMDLIVGAKSAGAGGTAEELVSVDYIRCRQAR